MATSSVKYSEMNMKAKSKSAHLGTRVTPAARQAFIARASKYSTTGDVLRELIEAFAEGRLIIQPPTTRDPKEKLYE